MENPIYTSPTPKQEDVKKDTTLTYFAQEALSTAAKWAKILAILNTVLIGLLILLTTIIFLFIPYGNRSSFMYIIAMGIVVIPLVFLYQFATKTQKALLLNSESDLEEGLNSLKNYFMALGIFSIISIVCIILGTIFSLALGSSLYGW